MSTPSLHFPQIAPIAWEHPADAAALTALRAVPGFDVVVARSIGRLNEWALKRRMSDDIVPVQPDSHPRLHRIYQEICFRLDVAELPPLFARQTGEINAAAVGMDQPFIVIGARAEDALEDDEIRVILGHEVAHILSGHVRYKTTLRALLYAGWAAIAFPVSAPVMLAVLAALLEWDRRSELSADRAAALVVGGVAPVIHTLKQVGGAPRSVFAEGTRLPKDVASTLDELNRFLGRLIARHPPIEERIQSLEAWEKSEAWALIQSGDYPRLGDEEHAARWSSVEAGARTVRAEIQEAAGDMLGWVDRLTQQADGWINKYLRSKD